MVRWIKIDVTDNNFLFILKFEEWGWRDLCDDEFQPIHQAGIILHFSVRS